MIAIDEVGPEAGDRVWPLLEPVFRAGDTYAIDPAIPRADALRYWFAHRVYLATDNGQTLGTYYLRPNQQGGGAHLCNCGYVTARDAEGRGVGRAMLAHSLAQARALGFHAMVYNFVVAANIRAVDTWTRAGFQIVGRVPRAFRHPQAGMVDALIMWKDLTDGN